MAGEYLKTTSKRLIGIVKRPNKVISKHKTIWAYAITMAKV